MLCDAACLFPLHNGRRPRHTFLVHGRILMTSCSSDEVGSAYFYLRWEERGDSHRTVVGGEDEWASPVPMILVSWVLVTSPHTQLLLNMTGNLSTLNVSLRADVFFTIICQLKLLINVITFCMDLIDLEFSLYHINRVNLLYYFTFLDTILWNRQTSLF